MKLKGNYILDGKTPVVCEDFLEWSIWMGTAERSVGLTRVANVQISTVFIGLDLSDDQPPKVFETMMTVIEDAKMDIGVAAAMKHQFDNSFVKTCFLDEAQLMHDECIDRVNKAVAAAQRNLSKKPENDADSPQP